MLDQEFVAAFLRGDADAPPDSWLHRENWLAWHAAMLPPGLLEKEVAKAVDCDREPWVWESLRRLYNDFRERGERIPPSLQRWVDDVVNGVRSRRPRRGPKPNSNQYSRYRIVYRVLRMGMGMTYDQALECMADSISTDDDLVSVDTVKSRVHRGASFARKPAP